MVNMFGFAPQIHGRVENITKYQVKVEEGVSGEKKRRQKFKKEREGRRGISTGPSQPEKRRACSGITGRERNPTVRREDKHAHALSFPIETKLGWEITQKKRYTIYIHI